MQYPKMAGIIMDYAMLKSWLQKQIHDDGLGRLSFSRQGRNGGTGNDGNFPAEFTLERSP
jgi:hypothetical protein